MKVAATILLLVGICCLALSFTWNPSAVSRGIKAAEEDDADDLALAHGELANPTAEDLRRQEQARTEIAAQAAAAEKAVDTRHAIQRLLRYTGYVLTLMGIGFLWQSRIS